MSKKSASVVATSHGFRVRICIRSNAGRVFQKYFSACSTSGFPLAAPVALFQELGCGERPWMDMFRHVRCGMMAGFML
jgi:hypothetical protein